MKKVLFISTRFGKNDGVSLETQKSDQVFQQMGYECYYFGAELPHYKCKGKVVEMCHFAHPAIYQNNLEVTGKQYCNMEEVTNMARKLEFELMEYVQEIKPDLISVQNALAIPMNVPLAIAITNVLRTTGIQAYSHNHDYYWERDRYLDTAYDEVFRTYFPPLLPNLTHGSINTIAQAEFKKRTGADSVLMPNVFDFNSDLNKLDDYNKHVKVDFEIDEDKIVFIQPTRLVRRKGIERSIELISRLPQRENIVLVLTGYAGDEVDTYEEEIVIKAKNLGVHTRFIGNRVADRRMVINTHRYYTLWDIFVNADFCTIPSDIEGFCNHFTEACYFKKPIFVNEYAVFKSDIKPHGFDVVTADGVVTDDAVAQVHEILNNPEKYQKMVNHNYELAKHIYSYDALRQNLEDLLK